MQWIPSGRIQWRFRDVPISNGSDAGHVSRYYHVDTPPSVSGSAHHVTRSELFVGVGGVSTDDNGTFVCEAENEAGVAAAVFVLHVVVPMPPKPPQVRRIDWQIVSYVDSLQLHLDSCAYWSR